MIEIKEYSIYDEEEILALYSSVGWTAYTDRPDTLKNGFENSLLCLAAYEGGQIVGIVRVVGDGYTIIFIQDILVNPEYQRKGIGTLLVQSVLERFDKVRQIELTTDEMPSTLAFYESLGFRKMSEIGCCGLIKVQREH